MDFFLLRDRLLWLVLISVSGWAAAQDNAAPAEVNGFQMAAEKYTIAAASGPDQPFELIPKPVLAWSNPERRTPAGVVYLYTDQGQPQVALCVYPVQDTLDHEFQSLATEPLLAHRDGVLAWAPAGPGLEWEALAGSPPPSVSPLMRLREMRTLSRKFEAEIFRERPDLPSIPLRLLPTPLYRYPASGLKSGVIDGAVFAFVQSTDPEVLLLLEAREDAQGARQWYYGLARMTMVRVRASLDGKEVWRMEWAVQNAATTYYTISGN